MEGRAHDCADENEEEAYFVVKGRGRMRIDGEEIELRTGHVVRIDPAARHEPIAGEEGLEFLTIGAPIDRSHSPLA